MLHLIIAGIKVIVKGKSSDECQQTGSLHPAVQTFPLEMHSAAACSLQLRCGQHHAPGCRFDLAGGAGEAADGHAGERLPDLE